MGLQKIAASSFASLEPWLYNDRAAVDQCGAQ